MTILPLHEDAVALRGGAGHFSAVSAVAERSAALPPAIAAPALLCPEKKGWPRAVVPTDILLKSAFQPILSFTHNKAVGREALLRAEYRVSGQSIAPADLFGEKAARDVPALVALDLAAVQQHLRAHEPGDGWLFLNLHPLTLGTLGAIDLLASMVQASRVKPTDLVIEVLEGAIVESKAFARAISALRDLGCLVAIDDFGAGHSNFERIFDVQPEIVKLDRNVIARAAVNPQARRVAAQMVSLIHECGSLVLVEGVETEQEAHAALCCDADFVQGYFFARPAAAPVSNEAGMGALARTWELFDLAPADQSLEWLDPHRRAIGLASAMLATGSPMEEACQRFLGSPGAQMCYLLDQHGQQAEKNVFAPALSAAVLRAETRFLPLHDTGQARWSRRQYFQAAMRQPGQVHLTRPYVTLQGTRICVTLSICFLSRGRALVLCGDVQVPAS